MLLAELINSDQTSSPAFKAWFKNSKITKNGKPMVVYHGSNSKFDEFDIKKMGLASDTGMRGKGFYFSPSKELVAKNYGSNIFEVYLSIQNPFDPSKYKSISEIAKALKMDSIYEEDDLKRMFKFDADKGEFTVFSSMSGTMTDFMKDAGFDGIVYEPRLEIIAFYPEQIKSATDNNGEFSASSKNIYM